MKKSVTFSAQLDTTDFDRSVEKIQKKLKEISPAAITQMQYATGQRMQQQGLGGSMSTPTTEAYQRATINSHKEIEKSIKEQAVAQEKLGKMISQRSETLKRLQSQQKEILKDSKEELELKQKIARVEENNNRLKEQYKRNDLVLNQSLDTRDSIRESRMQAIRDRNQGGFGLAGRYARQGMYGAAGREALGAIPFGKLLGGMGIAGLAHAGIQFGETMAGYPLRLEEATGTAISTMAGRDTGRMYAGKSPFDAFWMAEREKAAGLAKQKADKQVIWDILKGVGMFGAGAGAMMLGGAASSTGIGATLGVPAMIAGGGMMAGGIGMMAFNDKARSAVFNPEEYRRLRAADQSKDTMQMWETLKNQDAAKKAAMEKLEKDLDRNLHLQRTLGFNNQQFYGGGGFIQRGLTAGFQDEQMINMAQSILGAGGSARMGGQAQFGLQMQRAGITNASSILGTLSGGMPGAKESESAVISIISRAFKIGLDNTDFAEEQRKFAQIASNIISRTGAVTQEDQDRLASALGKFVTERTNVGVQSAQTAYERSQERSSQLGGRRGVMRMVQGFQDPSLQKLNTMEMTGLLGLRDEQLQPNDELVQYYASKAGVSPEELIKKVRGINKGSRFLVPGSQEEVDKFQGIIEQYKNKENISTAEFGKRLTQQRQGLTSVLPQDVFQAAGGIQHRIRLEEQAGLPTPLARSMMGEFLGEETVTETGKEKVRKGLEGVGERFEDKLIAAGAQGMSSFRDEVERLLPKLNSLIESTGKWNEEITKGTRDIERNLPGMRKNLPSGDIFGRDIINMSIPASIQDQSGKRSSGE